FWETLNITAVTTSLLRFSAPAKFKPFHRFSLALLSPPSAARRPPPLSPPSSSPVTAFPSHSQGQRRAVVARLRIIVRGRSVAFFVASEENRLRRRPARSSGNTEGVKLG
ncbi:hypothetical protein S83_054976, partial [Arachis hypogaea]